MKTPGYTPIVSMAMILSAAVCGFALGNVLLGWIDVSRGICLRWTVTLVVSAASAALLLVLLGARSPEKMDPSRTGTRVSDPLAVRRQPVVCVLLAMVWGLGLHALFLVERLIRQMRQLAESLPDEASAMILRSIPTAQAQRVLVVLYLAILGYMAFRYAFGTLGGDAGGGPDGRNGGRK